jgi:hypothetical protein
MESARIANVAWPALRKDLLTALLTSGLAAFAIVVLLLLARRLAGALVQPLGGFSLLGIVGLGLLLAIGWRLGWQARGRLATSLTLITPALPGIVLFLLLCVLSLPGTASWALMLTWLAFLSGEAAWWWGAYSSQRQTISPRGVSPAASATVEQADCIEPSPGSLPENVFQQITRFREVEQERIAIMLRIPFAAGQRTAVAHVAFCPPLGGVPELAAEATEGPSATVAITNPQSFGARLEIRLDEPTDEDCSVMIEGEGFALFPVLSPVTEKT